MSKGGTAWVNLDKRRCKTCGFWAKPARKRAMLDDLYACGAPAPDLKKVDAPVSYTIGFSRRYMARDEGAGCLFWKPKTPESPADERDGREGVTAGARTT